MVTCAHCGFKKRVFKGLDQFIHTPKFIERKTRQIDKLFLGHNIKVNRNYAGRILFQIKAYRTLPFLALDCNRCG